jgi:hypothetical protein
MGAGNPRLYQMTERGRVAVRPRWRRSIYRYGGKCYIVTGNPWTGWYRREVSAEQYAELEQLLRERYARQLEGYRSLPEAWRRIDAWSLGELQDFFGAYVNLHRWLEPPNTST